MSRKHSLIDRYRALKVQVAKVLRTEGPQGLAVKVLRRTRKELSRLSPVRRAQQRHLQRILAAAQGRRTVVMFPTVDWGWMVQRPHQLARHFARRGDLCFFVTPQTRVDRVNGFKEIEPNLYLCSDLSLLYGLERPMLLQSNTHFSDHLDRFQAPVIVYDYLDALEVTAGGDVTEDKVLAHREMLQRAHLVLTTARRLFDEVREVRSDAVLVPNGVDPAHFAPREASPVPQDLRRILAKQGPVFGYYGAMAEWFDYELIRFAAEAMPEAQFVLIGPDYDGSISRLTTRDNVHYLGLKSYEELPAYLQRFDVAMIPFKINAITRATSPVKLFEYMAGRKPIVTTAMDEAFHYQSVLIGETPKAFVAKLEEALNKRQDPAYLSLLDAEGRANTWTSRVESVMQALDRRETDARDTYVILAGVPIDDSGGGQRPTQIALELLTRGERVIFVSMLPKYEDTELNQKIVHPWLETCDFEHFDLTRYFPQGLGDRKLVAILEMPHPDFLPTLEQVQGMGGRVVYDLIDDWRTMLGGSWYLREAEERIIRDADALIASAGDLRDYLAQTSNRSVALVQNAVNLNLFSRQATHARPSDLPAAPKTLLYIGALWGEWFDWEAMRLVAEAYPHTSVVLIGDHQGRCPYPLPPNMSLLGLKRQQDLPAYLAHADVTLIPFKLSPLTQAVSPLKVFEYLAMGKPVVSTNMRELHGLPHVHLADSHEAFVEAVQAALDAPVDLAAIDRFIALNSWRQRIDTIQEALGMPTTPAALGR
ncbi:glycosyltransferase [bacterium]|nr:glycosyltransferase [bacterium]